LTVGKTFEKETVKGDEGSMNALAGGGET